MAAQKKLQELFHDTLKDIYFAEKKILTAFAKDGEGRAGTEELKAGLRKARDRDRRPR